MNAREIFSKILRTMFFRESYSYQWANDRQKGNGIRWRSGICQTAENIFL